MPAMSTPVLIAPGTDDVGDLEIGSSHGYRAAQPKRLRRLFLVAFGV